MKQTKFDIILADPPWLFSAWNAKKSNRHVSHKYQLMDVDAICNLQATQLASENCALFLWATWPNIKDAFRVIDAWGFTYRTLAWEWVKSNRSGMGFHFGMGYYTRANPEPCLLAVRGRMPVQSHSISALIYSPVREHSRKPDDQYRKIEALYPEMNYLELFARQERPGWVALGNEVGECLDLRESLKGCYEQKNHNQRNQTPRG
jgi:N6-adenosine-specific RNA methylase IME4